MKGQILLVSTVIAVLLGVSAIPMHRPDHAVNKASSSRYNELNYEIEEVPSSSSRRDRTIQRRVIDPDEVLCPSLRLVGPAYTPAQKLFKKIFSLKKFQYRTAMKYGNSLCRILDKNIGDDAYYYKEAENKLDELASEGYTLDNSRIEAERIYGFLPPLLLPEIQFQLTPKDKSDEGMPLDILAAEKAKELMIVARKLHFELSDSTS